MNAASNSLSNVFVAAVSRNDIPRQTHIASCVAEADLHTRLLVVALVNGDIGGAATVGELRDRGNPLPALSAYHVWHNGEHRRQTEAEAKTTDGNGCLHGAILALSGR